MNYELTFPPTFWVDKVSDTLGIEDGRFLSICCEYVECHREDCGIGIDVPDKELDSLIDGVLVELNDRLRPYRLRCGDRDQFEKYITDTELKDIFPIQWLKERLPDVAMLSLIEEYYNERTDQGYQFDVQGHSSLGGGD